MEWAHAALRQRFLEGGWYSGTDICSRPWGLDRRAATERHSRWFLRTSSNSEQATQLDDLVQSLLSACSEPGRMDAWTPGRPGHPRGSTQWPRRWSVSPLPRVGAMSGHSEPYRGRSWPWSYYWASPRAPQGVRMIPISSSQPHFMELCVELCVCSIGTADST